MRKNFMILLWIGLVLMTAQTQAKVYTWDIFGYTNPLFYPPGKSPLFSTPAALCDSFSAGFRQPQQACYSQASMKYFCVPAIFSCAEENRYANSDTSIDAEPVCTHSPELKSAPLRGVAGRTGFNLLTGKCSCFSTDFSKPAPTLHPDLDTGLCYTAPALQVFASRDRYKPSEADKPIDIDMFVLRNNLRMPNVDIQLSVVTDEGAPGKLSATSGTTDANGDLVISYTFPDFTQKKVDKIIISCDICSDDLNSSTVDIKMSPTLVGFFNGVWNTEEQASDGLKHLKFETENIRGKVSTAYDLFYNQSGCGRPGTTCLQDIAEVFEQRSKELDGVVANRWENFWDLLAGRHASPQSGIGGLLTALGNPALALAQLFDATFNAMLANMASGWALMLSNPPTGADSAAHLAKLKAYASDDFTMVLIAHSQGNLFLNTAYDGIRSSHPQIAAKVVHVAPASPTLRGDYVLADIDLVINGLRLQGVTSVPAANIGLPYSGADASGHMLVATYLDASRNGLERVKAMIKTALSSL
jgi:hypothetical protein